MYRANIHQKKAKAIILISDKIDFKAKKITRGKEKHYIMIKKLILQEVIAILNTYAQNNWTANTVCEAKTYSTNRRNRQIFNYSQSLEYPLSISDRTNGQKISKRKEKLNNTNRRIHFFSSDFRTYIKTDHILDPKNNTSVNLK